MKYYYNKSLIISYLTIFTFSYGYGIKGCYIAKRQQMRRNQVDIVYLYDLLLRLYVISYAVLH